mgnify:CR=1 FL=1
MNILQLSIMRREILIKFGKNVREERTKLDLSQEELASRAGVHRTYIGMIERAEKNITLENIQKVCRALNLRVGNFFVDF